MAPVRQETLSLLEKAQAGDGASMDTLVRENAGLIWSVARRFFGRGTEAEDLYQLGCLGFLKAVQGFDPGFGAQFSTYAVPKIAGEIRRFLRDDGTLKVSRGLKSQAAQVGAARRKLEQEYGREPTVGELAAETGLTPEEIATSAAATAEVASLNVPRGETGGALEQVLCDPGQEEQLLEHVALREALARLPEKERAVLGLRYYRGMTQAAAARVLGVSQVQVSRIERRALARLKEGMAGE